MPKQDKLSKLCSEWELSDEILQTINSREELLEGFDEQIFNALVEKIEIFSPTHFVFELKSGLRIEVCAFHAS